MNQNQVEKIFAPNTETEGELRRPETTTTPELELNKEQASEGLETTKEQDFNHEQITPTLPQTKKKITLPSPARDKTTIKVEQILSAGLEDTYKSLSPLAQQEFKLKGEETALKIREMLRQTKIKVKKIFKLIIEWLSMLPGVNRFFLEQEAKIKTDKIIELKKQESNNIEI